MGATASSAESITARMVSDSAQPTGSRKGQGTKFTTVASSAQPPISAARGGTRKEAYHRHGSARGPYARRGRPAAIS